LKHLISPFFLPIVVGICEMSVALSIGCDEEPFCAACSAACSAISRWVWRSASAAIRAGSRVQIRTIMSEQQVTASPLGIAVLCQTVPAWMMDCLHCRSLVDQNLSVQSSEEERIVWLS